MALPNVTTTTNPGGACPSSSNSSASVKPVSESLKNASPNTNEVSFLTPITTPNSLAPSSTSNSVCCSECMNKK